MRGSTRDTVVTGDNTAMPAAIGLIGRRKSGMTGIVRSLLVEASAPGASLFADSWRISPANSPSERAGAHGDPAEGQRDNLLAYLAPDSAADSGADGDGRLRPPQAPPRDPGPNHFVVASASTRWLRRTGESHAVQILDTSAARTNRTRSEPGWVTHAYQAAPHVVLCHPILPRADEEESYKPIFDRLRQRFAATPDDNSTTPLRTLVVAFAQYEKMFVANPRDAARRAVDPDIARSHLQFALRQCPELTQELTALSDMGHLRIVGVPVSTYGFVRDDGRPNLDLWLWEDDAISGERSPARLLTRHDIYRSLCREARSDAGRPYDPTAETGVTWLLRHWQPFLTADPFIACVTGKGHELVFSLSSLLEGASAHRAA